MAPDVWAGAILTVLNRWDEVFSYPNEVLLPVIAEYIIDDTHLVVNRQNQTCRLSTYMSWAEDICTVYEGPLPGAYAALAKGV